MVKFDKAIFIKGGEVKCKSCRMVTKFKPHKNAGRKRAKPQKWSGDNPDTVT